MRTESLNRVFFFQFVFWMPIAADLAAVLVVSERNGGYSVLAFRIGEYQRSFNSEIQFVNDGVSDSIVFFFCCSGSFHTILGECFPNVFFDVGIFFIHSATAPRLASHQR